MPTRMYPADYFNEQAIQPRKLQTEPTIIPSWVPILIAIALIGSFAVALYALSLTKKGGGKEYGSTGDT